MVVTWLLLFTFKWPGEIKHQNPESRNTIEIGFFQVIPHLLQISSDRYTFEDIEGKKKSSDFTRVNLK